jgi:Mnd1 HTH domain
MSKRKGLSAEDKRRVILSIYHEKKEPFNLKEIETLASKMVG